MKAVTKSRDSIINGSGWFRFRDLPEAWRQLAYHVKCVFCSCGQQDGVEGMWGFGPPRDRLWVCNRCARAIVDGNVPEAVR